MAVFPKFEYTEIEEVETETLRRLKANRTAHYLPPFIRTAEVQEAARLGGQCVTLLLAIHFRRAVTNEELVTLPSGFLAEFGIGKNAKQRGLKRLEEAKLIDVKRILGHTALIELRAKRKALPKSPRETAPRALKSRRTPAARS